MSPQTRRYVVGILVLALIISVGLNLYDHFITLPQIQATANNMRTEALLGWLDTIGNVRHTLERSGTSSDVYEARHDTLLAGEFVDIYGMGIGYDPETGRYAYKPETLLHWLRGSTKDLEYAVMAIYVGNQTGPVTSRPLDYYVSLRIMNITMTIRNIENSMTISANGVDPVRQLQEKGNLDIIIDYCKQISETYDEIAIYYPWR
jgi:hypothetical protein